MENELFIFPQEDRVYIENKYHNTNEPFDGFNRMAYHGYEYDSATGLSDEEIDDGLKVLVNELGNLPRSVIKARAVEFVLDNTRIDINKNDYFPGIYSWGRLIDKHTINIWLKEAVEKTEKTLNDSNVHALINAGAMSINLDFDHIVPDYDSMLELGFGDILNRAQKAYDSLQEKTESQEAFFVALKIEYEAILRFIDRLYKYSLSKSFDKQKRISDSLKNLYNGAPLNSYDVLLMIYLYFMIN